MIQSKASSYFLNKHVEEGHGSLLDHLLKFEKLLLLLRYEGKPRVGKNVRNTRHLLQILEKDLTAHFKLEEKAIFPFLGNHVPRLGPVIRMLESDHADLKNQMRHLKTQLRGVLSREKREGMDWHIVLREVQTMGNYMAHFMKNHLKAEDSIIHQAIKYELHPEEEKQLWEKVSRLGNAACDASH